MSNRELDERVARVLGWKFNPEGDEDGYCWVSNHPVPYRAHAPVRYSSDWSCCEEMLAWLIPHSDSLYGKVDLVASDDESVTRAEILCMGETITGRGKDLTEALARLVVAVAEAKERKQ